MTKLSVNVNKVALLRNSRAHGVPDIDRLSTLALEAGADGLTVHPRPDQRHIRSADVPRLARLCGLHRREFNIEGNPFHNLLEHCERSRPTQATLVPDALEAPTSDHGWTLFDLADAQRRALTEAIGTLKRLGCRVSLFVDPDPQLMPAARALGADRVELYTEPYAAAPAAMLERYAATAAAARAVGLGVNAGHDLNATNLPAFVTRVAPDEVSIGHALIADALELGMSQAVALYATIAHGTAG